MQYGWLIDCYADEQRSRIVVWLWNRQAVKFEFPFSPSFYIYHNDTAEVERRLRGLEKIDVRRVCKKTAPFMHERELLEISTRDFILWKKLSSHFHSENSHSFEVYNADISPEQQFMLEKNIFPFSFMRISGSKIECMDSQNELYYDLPALHICSLSSNMYSTSGSIQKVCIDGEYISGEEERVLHEITRVLDSIDADIVITEGGDRALLPLLFRRAHELGINSFRLGRECGKRGYSQRTYTAYGRTMYRPAPVFLNGRIHIDVSNSFIFRESGVEGLAELSRLSNIPPQQLSRLSPGSAVSSMEVIEAYRRNVAVPWNKNMPEKFKSAAELLKSDRGGFIYNPVTGFFTDVYSVDFSSMYPSIMARENISFDTLNCSCCSTSAVPDLSYHFCSRKKGIVSSVVKGLIERRRAYAMTGGTAAEQRRTALKWVLVTSFGYTGYRNAKFGSIECHESINAFGREILLRTAKRAEASGFRVLHGIIDSLWLKGEGDIKRLVSDVSREERIPLEIEGKYRWIVFLPNKTNTEGSLNRYYGVFENGEYKLRGIELRRSDAPDIVSFTQYLLLEAMRDASQADVKQRIEMGLKNICSVVSALRAHTYPSEGLVIKRRFSKRAEEYVHDTRERRALLHLLDAGMELHPGESAGYILSRKDALPVQPGAMHSAAYDASAYMHLVAAGLETMLLPFGYDRKRIEKRMSIRCS